MENQVICFESIKYSFIFYSILDPYVKVTLVSKGKRIKKKKTSVMKNTLNPGNSRKILKFIIRILLNFY
jgi:hypothetical protein